MQELQLSRNLCLQIYLLTTTSSPYFIGIGSVGEQCREIVTNCEGFDVVGDRGRVKLYLQYTNKKLA